MYGYNDLIKDTKLLLDLGYRAEYIGRTVYGKPIPAFLRGDAPDTLIVGGTHARESITARLVAQLAREFKGDGVCFLPLLNIDGAETVKHGISAVPPFYRPLIKRAVGNGNIRLFKANGRAVDINVNYDADWGCGKSNRFYPSAESYVGEFAESEPETRASAELVRKYRFCTLISYHTKGEVIYSGYKGVFCEAHADMLTALTGYPHEEAVGSVGGFKDWFIKEGFGDGYTIEVGSDTLTHPIDEWDYPEIYRRNKGVCALLESKEWKLIRNSCDLH